MGDAWHGVHDSWATCPGQVWPGRLRSWLPESPDTGRSSRKRQKASSSLMLPQGCRQGNSPPCAWPPTRRSCAAARGPPPGTAAPCLRAPMGSDSQLVMIRLVLQDIPMHAPATKARSTTSLEHQRAAAGAHAPMVYEPNRKSVLGLKASALTASMANLSTCTEWNSYIASCRCVCDSACMLQPENQQLCHGAQRKISLATTSGAVLPPQQACACKCNSPPAAMGRHILGSSRWCPG